jgi:hypothetical protein
MIDALAELVVAFPGAANRTRCFAHILNLVVKVILRQFDLPKAMGGEALDIASQALLDLAGDVEIEEAAMDKGDDDDDSEEGSIDPRDGLSLEEQDELDATVRPVRLVLVKVSSNSDHMDWCSHQTLATKTCVRNQKLHDDPTSSLDSDPSRSYERC